MLSKNRYQRGSIRSLVRSLCLGAIALSIVGIDSVKANQNLATPTQQVAVLSGVDLDPYIETYAELVYLNYRDSHTQAAAMAGAISDFLAQPNETTHSEAKTAWIKARQSYLQTEAFRFYEGPIDYIDSETGEEGPEGRINAWPMNEAFIDYVKGKSDAGLINNPDFEVSLEGILENDQVTDEADVTTGWHAIEFLLWGQDFNDQGPGQRSYEDFIPDQGNNNRRREYLQLVTVQLLEDLAFLEESWKPGADNFRAEFVNSDPQENISKIFTSLATLSAFEISSERMAVALDSGNQEDEHSCFSDTTYQDFVYNTQGIYNVYTGNYQDYQGQGFDELVSEINPDLNQQMIAALDKTQSSVVNIAQPFDQVLASPAGSPEREDVEAAITSLEDQAEMFQQVGNALGIEVEILAE
ncbi:putative iron-regulated protein [Xenococcus sp. PCC 7305]|nr:putative iron-regulated protein [Xenococcus sp. PCC 7305]